MGVIKMNKRLKLNLQFFAETQMLPDYITASNITAYWEAGAQNRKPYLGEELFPEQQKLGLKLELIKGSSGLPVVLKPSAYDAVSQKRDRLGITLVQMNMPFFKEAMMVDEEQRQQLNMVLETGNQAYIDTILTNIFDDEVTLLEGASAQRERIRMMALTTGAVSIVANGQAYDYDYGMPNNHKVTVSKSWSDSTSDIISDIRDLQDVVSGDTGVTPVRAVCSRKTFGYFRANKLIRQAILGSDATAAVSDKKIMDYLKDELNLELVVYSKKFKNESGVATQYVPDDTFVMFPSGDLGTGWFGTTPEQSDLMSSNVANVSITDVGVAVTTTQKTDPVNVDTKVSMIYLPSFETIDQIGIIDVIAD